VVVLVSARDWSILLYRERVKDHIDIFINVKIKSGNEEARKF